MEYREVTDYKELLQECFITDIDLINIYHIEAGKGIEACINRTFDDLKLWNVKVFGLYEDNEIVGYFGKEANIYLTGFFIKPEYRNSNYIFLNNIIKT